MPPEGARTSQSPTNLDAAVKVFEDFGDFIRSVIRHRVADNDRANDLIQDFFLSLVANPIPPDVRNIKSYLYKAMTNDVTDSISRMDKYRNRLHRYAERVNNTVNNDCPENALVRVEEIRKTFELIQKRLPPSEARAVVMRYRDDCDIGEMATAMAVNRRSVSRYLSAGLRKIRQFLKEKQGDAE